MIAIHVLLEPSVAQHFLLKNLSLTCKTMRGGTEIVPVTRTAGGFSFAIDETIPGSLEIDLEARYRYDSHDFVLLRIRQTFRLPTRPDQPGIVPERWFKVHPATAQGSPVAIPPLHPLLTVAGSDITVAPKFLDITQLFMHMHGHTPWFRALAIVKGTDFKLRVLAHLRGHPFVWYAIVPPKVSTGASVTPHVCYWAADYGGFPYEADKERGLTTSGHNTSVDTSVGSIQCGGETLCSYLLTPLDHAEYRRVIANYTAVANTFPRYRTNKNVRLPPQLHHYGTVLSYDLVDGKLVPKYWDVPFGLERAIEPTDQLLLFPQINGGDAGQSIKGGLKSLAESAIATIYTQSGVMVSSSYAVNKLILSCYSESGGNLFTASENNAADIKAIICVEPQYMNEYLKDKDTGKEENKNLRLGHRVIPILLAGGTKVFLINRRREPWQRGKYLPKGVDLTRLTLLPAEPNLKLLDYPQKPTHKLIAHRYARLLKHNEDETIKFIQQVDQHDIEDAVVVLENKINGLLDDLRSKGTTDDQLIASVFTSDFNIDNFGGFYTHNFVIAGGESEAAFEADGKLKPGARYTTFFQDAVAQIR